MVKFRVSLTLSIRADTFIRPLDSAVQPPSAWSSSIEMDSCRRQSTIFALVMTFVCLAAMHLTTSVVAAASEPRSINDLATLNREFTSDERDRVRQYARYWSSELLAEDAERARLAKRRMLDPFRTPGLRRIFRDEYGRAAIPALSEIISSDNTFAAVNAIQIVAEFGNEAALTVMRERCETSSEPRWQIRLWAARGAGNIIQRAGDDIPSRTIESALRDLSRAGESESKWLVLQRQFEALASASGERAHQAQLSLLRATLARMSDEPDGPSELMLPVHRALILLRNQILDPNLPSAQLRALGTELGPLLGQIFEISIMHWDTAKVNSEVTSSYNGAIGLAESLLSLIDAQVRQAEPPRTALVSAWSSDNRSTFESDFDRWRRVLGGPPYAGR